MSEPFPEKLGQLCYLKDAGYHAFAFTDPTERIGDKLALLMYIGNQTLLELKTNKKIRPFLTWGTWTFYMADFKTENKNRNKKESK